MRVYMFDMASDMVYMARSVLIYGRDVESKCCYNNISASANARTMKGEGSELLKYRYRFIVYLVHFTKAVIQCTIVER